MSVGYEEEQNTLGIPLFSSSTVTVEKDNEGQEQVGEPMAATVNERVEYNMDDIKEMVLEVLNKIKKKKKK